MPCLFREKGLTKYIIILGFAFFMLFAINILPVWADQTADSFADSVCSYSDSSTPSADQSGAGSDSSSNSSGAADTGTTSDCSVNGDNGTSPAADDSTSNNAPATESTDNNNTEASAAAADETSSDVSPPNTAPATESTDNNNTEASAAAADETSSDVSPPNTAPATESTDNNNEETTAPADDTAGNDTSSTTAPATESTDNNNEETTAPADNTAGDETSSNTAPETESIDNNNETAAPAVTENAALDAEQTPAEGGVASISQGPDKAGDPWGYILDAVTELAVAGADVEVWKIVGGTQTNQGVITETNPVTTNASGEYDFIVTENADYQLKITKSGYADLISKIYSFTKDGTTHVEDLYLVPLVTDAAGHNINLKHDLITDGQDISIENAGNITTGADIKIDTRSSGGSTGSVSLQADTDITIAHNISAPGVPLTISAKNITVNNHIIVDTRQINEAGNTTGHSGHITMTGRESLMINNEAQLLAQVSEGSSYTPGTITLTALNDKINGIDLVNMTIPATSSSVTVNGSINGGDVIIKASAGRLETAGLVGASDQSQDEWTIDKLQEYISDIIPLPVIVRMRDSQATVNINSGAVITASKKVTVESDATAEARAKADYLNDFVGYLKAKARSEVNINDGAVITAIDDVLLRSRAVSTADLEAVVDNSNNTHGFSLGLGITDTDLFSHAAVTEGAHITGKNINVQALGNNHNHVSTTSTQYADGKLMGLLSLNFTKADVKAQADGNLTAAGEEPASGEDTAAGIGILSRLYSDDSARTIVGAGTTGGGSRPSVDIEDNKAETAKDKIIGFFKKNYDQKVDKAANDNKHNSGASKNLQVAAACSCSKIDNDVAAIVGSTADLKSGLDLEVKAEIIETARTLTKSWADSGSDTSISAAASIGLYDNSALTTFSGQSDARRNTVISSSVSYPFLLQPFKDPATWSFKDGLSPDGEDLIIDILGLQAQMINSWTTSTASGEFLGLGGAVVYLEYNNDAVTNVTDTARINQRPDSLYRSDEQTVAVNAAADLAQITVTGGFDFNLSSADMDSIAYRRGTVLSDDDKALVIPSAASGGKTGIGGSILLSYINNSAKTNIDSGARIHAGSNGGTDITVSNRVTSIEFVQSGGQANKFGVSGSFALDNETADVSALVNRGTILDSGQLNIKADAVSTHLNILGGVIKSDGVGIGSSIGINEITRTILAGITEPENSAPESTNNITVSRDTSIEASAKGDILVATVAASKPANSGDAPDQSKDTSQTAAGAPRSGSTGGGKSQGKFGIGVSAAVSINEVNDTVKALVNYSDKLSTGSLQVKAVNETNILALTGSAAYTKSAQQNSGTMAGAYSQITLTGHTDARVIGTEMDTDLLILTAERLGNLWAISAGGANSPGKNGIAVAGSVSINNITNYTNVLVDGMTGTVSGNTVAKAQDKSSMHVIAGAEGYGGRGGFGAAVAYNDLHNDTSVKIKNSNWMQMATLDLLAENSIRAGPIDESFDVSGNPADNVEILAVAASLGVSPQGNFGGAGTVAVNLINNTVEASMTDSVCNFSSTGQASFTGRDDANIFSIAGAIGGAKNVGLGAAVAYNQISNHAYSFINNSTLNNPIFLSLITESGGTIKTLSLGAAGAQDAALGGSVSVNTITSDVSAYIKNSTVTAVDSITISATGHSGIGSLAGGFAGAGKAAVGAAAAINNIGKADNPNLIKAYIDSSRVTVNDGSLSIVSASHAVIKSISAGGAGAEKCAIGGAVSVNNIVNTIEAYIINCSGDQRVWALNDITLDAADNSAIGVIAGTVAGAGTAAVAGSASTVFIGYYDPVDQTVTYSKTRAYIQNSQVTSANSDVKLTATCNSVIFNVAAGTGVAGTFGGQGSVCLNSIYNDLAALIIDAVVTAKGDISARAVAIKRTTIPRGATQPQADATEISVFDGNPDDRDEEGSEGEATTHAISSVQALAGSVAGGGTAGIGLVAAANKIANLISAGIDNSTVTSEGNIRLTALSEASIDTISAALAAAGEFAGAGSVSLNEINNEISAFIVNSRVEANNTSNVPADGVLPGISLNAGDTSVIRSVSGGIGISGTAGLGGAAAYNEIANVVKAYILGCKTAGIDTGDVNSHGHLTVTAQSAAVIKTVSAGGAFGGYGGVAGSVSINTISNTVEAYVKDSTVDIDDNIYILANSNNTIYGYGGAMAGGLAGVSGAVVVNTVENKTKSYISHSTVTASGAGNSITVKNWNENGDESAEDLKGLVVIAASDDVIEMYSGAAAGGAAAVSGQTSVNLVKELTEAFIAASYINSASDPGQWVKVKAHQGTRIDIWAGGLCVSGAGVGAAVDRTLVENTTRAYISDRDVSGTDPDPLDSVIYARGLEVTARTGEEVNSNVAGIAFSGTASGAGAVSVINFDSKTLAVIARSSAFSLGPIRVRAVDKAILDSKAATFAASAGGALAGSVAVNNLGNTVQASVLGANLNSSGAIEVKSQGEDKIIIRTGGVGLGQGGVGGVVSFNTIEAITESCIANSGDRVSLINQDARFKPGGVYAPDSNQKILVRAENTSTVDNTGLAGGAGIYIGGGAAVDVTRVQNRTVAYIGAGSKVYSKGDINIEAQATKIIDSKTAAVGMGLVGISGAISITTLGEAISGEGANQFTGELRQQVNSDTSVKNLKINTSDSTANKAGTKVNGLSVPNLDDILATTQDTSGKITAAYIEDGTAGGAKAEIVSNGNVNIKAINNYTITGTRGQVAVGAAAAGASITIINTYDRTKAFVGSYSTIRANNITVLADSTETATAESYAAQAGLYAGGGNIAHVKIHPLVEASLGSYSSISALNQVAVTAAVKPQAKASVYGVTVAVGAKVAVADATAESTPIVNASIGQNAQVTCGYQPLGGNPVLTFSSGSQLTGSPTLTFTVKSVQMSGNPTLHFAAGTGGANDTVSRNDGGSWNSDGFKIGDYISIDGTDKNNAVYQITNISGDGKTLTLDTQGVVKSEDKSGANVYIERAGEIQRSSGSWYDDAFIEGEFILVSGTETNDGYYEIGRIIDNNTLELDVSDEIQNQVSSGSIIGDTADMIRRSTGSWLDDGFAAGQIIKVSGSANNDGQYTVKSISDDGKVLTLDSLNFFTKEQVSGVNITIVDYSDSNANTAGLKINAGESLPAAGSTAEAYAFGAGGALLSIDCTMAKAKNTSAVAAWVANNANLIVAGTVEISADTATKQTAEADGYNFGGVQAGNNKAWASSSSSGDQLNITTAGLQDNVRVSALKLLISAYRTDENYAEAFAGSGGAFDLVLIEAQTENKAATRASMGTGAVLDVDRLQILADHTAKFNSKADAVSGALVGVGAGRANNDINSTVEANIGSSSTILAKEMTVYANNRTNKDWLSGYNVQSRSGGVLDFQAAESKTDITNTTNINVGDNTSIWIPGSVFNSGCLTMEILNSVLARDKVNIDIGGAITGAKAVSQINNTNNGTVQIGKNVTIVSASDISLSARTYSNIQTYAAAKCYGAAGLASGDSRAISNSTNNIVINEGSHITSFGQINLLAGQSSEGFPNTCYSLASADVNNWTAVCLKTSPKACGEIHLDNNIVIGNASLRAVKDANLLTEEGIRITDGTGTAKNLYSEFLGMDCRTIDTTIDVNSRAKVDGSIEVGIQNQQLLTIEADGTVSTITDGVTYIKTKYEMHSQLLEELEWARLMRSEYAGTEAEEAFNDEIIRLQGELIELGHQVYNNGMIEESVWADYISINDIWAQSSNIKIIAGTLTGSGSIQARGDAKIEIINKSPAYLRLNRLTIPENAGGKVMFKRSLFSDWLNLDSGLFNGVRIISGSSSGEPQITIKNTYTGETKPDIELYGNVENRNGPLYVSSTGGITSKGNIRAGSVTLEATGDFIQSYVDTFYPVGGEPHKIWKPVTDKTESWHSIVHLSPFDKIDGYVTEVLNTQPQSKIEAANIVISARYLNINGAIISGHPDQSLVLDADLNSKIAGFWASRHWDYHDNLITENGGVKAYFDLITRRVIVEGVSAEGGYVSLFGQIMNTGKGRVEALDGYASIHIENHTNYDMMVGALDTGRGSEGMVVIKDTAPMTWLPASYSAPVVRVYTRLGDQIQVWDSVSKTHQVATYNDNATYQPLAGLRYKWVTAQSKLTRTSTTYRKSSWMGVDWLAKDPGSIYKQSTILLDAEPLLNGEYIEYRPDLVNLAYKYKYKSELVTQYDAEGNPILDKDGNPTSVLVYQDSWVKKKWWGKKTYYLKRVYQKATKDVNYHSIKADYPIAIIFKGSAQGTVDITSDQGLFMNGSIINPNGVTTVSARGSVEQTEGTYIQSQDITVISDKGIGNNAALSIDLNGGSLTARALQGIINISEINGELKLAGVNNNNGNVLLSAKGNIIGSTSASAVTGKLVSLASESGGIGTLHTPLLVDSGTNAGEGIRAQAYNGIYLKKTNGDINIVKATSDAGDVYVEAVNGSIYDANPEFSRDTITEGFVIRTWQNQGLSGQMTAAELRYLIGVTLQTNRKPDIWQEDLNIKGNNLTLQALNGAIGRYTGQVTIDLSDLAALDRSSQLTLSAADPDDIRFYDINNNLILPGDKTALAEYAVVDVPDDIDFAADTISAEAGDIVYLNSNDDAGINRVRGGEVRIRSSKGINNAADDGSINIISDDLVMVAENGNIGALEKPLLLAVKDGCNVRALAGEAIYLDQKSSGAGRSGTLNIDYVHSLSDVSLQAADSILRINSGNSFDITCRLLRLTAAGGNIGNPGNSLKIEQEDNQNLRAVAGEDIFIEELSGDMLVDQIQAEGDVNLLTPGSIRAAADDGNANIAGNNLNLTAVNGQVGAADRTLRLDSSRNSSGLVNITAYGDIYIKEMAGDLNLDLIKSLSPGRVFIASNGGILNGTGGINIEADVLKMEALSGAGMQLNPVRTAVTRAEGCGGQGGFFLDNQGGLIVGGVDYSINGIQADGSISLTAHSPITISEDIRAGADLDITAGNSSSLDDLIIEAGCKLQAGGSINLRAGDNILINPDAEVKAGSMINAQAGKTVLVDGAVADGGDTVTIRAEDGNVILHQAAVQSGNNVDIWASGDVELDMAAVKSGQNITIFTPQYARFIAGTTDAGNSVDLKAGEDILIDEDSVIAAVNEVKAAGDFGNNDPGDGCKIEIYGTLKGQYMEARGESDADEFIITNASIRGPLTILGGAGDDEYTVTDLDSIPTYHNGRKDRITMDGQEGADIYEVNLAGSRDYIVEALDTGTVGRDILTLHGSPQAEKLLLRRKFIANLHGTDVERINYDQNIENLYIYTFAGDDHFYMDDNSSLTEIYGAEGNDVFQIGQMFGSARDANAGVAPGDEIETVLTTRGYLSRGISYETKIYGADGNDSFSVYSNQAQLVLKGESGNDIFSIRAFALADPDDPNQPRTSVDGGTGDDYIEYNVNALVDIDGGEGNDLIRIIGSEFDDVFVISENGIVGAGLNVKSAEIEYYDAYGMEGNDTFYIQGTKAGVVTRIIGGYGSDSFYILGDVTKHVSTSGSYETMVDHDLDRIKGTLIIEGGVSSEGEDCMLVPGVTLPTETDADINAVPAEDESKMTDSLYIYNDDSSGGDSGYLTVGHLKGLGMGTGTTINQGTPDDPEYVEYPGGILFSSLEAVEILLGAGDDVFQINNTSPDTLTVVHGGGGHDEITADGYGGPLVIFGDTDAWESRYFGIKGIPSVNGHRFNNSDYDQVDVSFYLNWAAVYGGPGDDYITGTGFNDCLAGGPGSDSIEGGCGDDLIYGDSGFTVDPVLRSLRIYNPWPAGNDFLEGGYGDDIIFGDYGVSCYLSLRHEKLNTKGTEIQTAGIDGQGDFILGGPGDDLLIGGPGSDTIDGQDGDDLIFGDNAVKNPYYNMWGLIQPPSLQVVEKAAVISYTDYARWNYPGDAVSPAELLAKLLLTEPPFSSELGAGVDYENVVVIRFTRYIRDKEATYLSVTVLPDSSAVWWAKWWLMLQGDAYGEGDYLVGGPGNDAILGQCGDDIIQGDGSITGNRAWVQVSDGMITRIHSSVSQITDGHDYIEGGSDDDIIFGNDGNDDITGGSSDLFWSKSHDLPSAGKDIIFGGSGINLADGLTEIDNEDDDVIIGDNGNIYRILLGDQGTVLFLDRAGADTSLRAVELLDYGWAEGSQSPGDVIHGEYGDDFIHGMKQNDFLYGEAGNDHIIGGSGHDQIFGGSGEDRIIEDNLI